MGKKELMVLQVRSKHTQSPTSILHTLVCIALALTEGDREIESGAITMPVKCVEMKARNHNWGKACSSQFPWNLGSAIVLVSGANSNFGCETPAHEQMETPQDVLLWIDFVRLWALTSVA